MTDLDKVEDPPSAFTERYRRYQVETETAPDITPHPHRFRVRVNKRGLAALLLKELVRYRGNREVLLSRPCVYGVFSGPLGGFAPRERLCVGCLRCTTQYPEFVRVEPNPERLNLGDSYLNPDLVDTIVYEARTGRVPVKGAGYRGRFGGTGWDGMWTDMSEIVRPTRDGIHGRESISTAVDLGEKPMSLELDEHGAPTGRIPKAFQIQLPMLFDPPPASAHSPLLFRILTHASRELETLALVPLSQLAAAQPGPAVVPLVSRAADRETWERLTEPPRMIELDGWDEPLWNELSARFPESVVCVRLPFGEDLWRPLKRGVRALHLTADAHGRGDRGRFVMELIRETHQPLVEAGLREELTLIGSGGIVAAEHIPKAIICGLDAVALDTPLLAALQARFEGEGADPGAGRVRLPPGLTLEWGVRRIKNLMASWRDQLLEVLGAMGLREVRRLRGELGRAMFQQELEREAFGEIEGYVD